MMSQVLSPNRIPHPLTWLLQKLPSFLDDLDSFKPGDASICWRTGSSLAWCRTSFKISSDPVLMCGKLDSHKHPSYKQINMFLVKILLTWHIWNRNVMTIYPVDICAYSTYIYIYIYIYMCVCVCVYNSTKTSSLFQMACWMFCLTNLQKQIEIKWQKLSGFKLYTLSLKRRYNPRR